jgi:hypothetical protein
VVPAPGHVADVAPAHPEGRHQDCGVAAVNHDERRWHRAAEKRRQQREQAEQRQALDDLIAQAFLAYRKGWNDCLDAIRYRSKK